MSDRIFNVDATALFYSDPRPDCAALLDTLNAAFAGVEGGALTRSPLSHDGWWLLCCEQFHIMLGFHDAPAPMARFAQAVTSPITRLSRFEYEHAAQNHNLHVSIEIGDGHAPLPPEARKIMQEFGSGTRCDPALKIKALHHTAQFIAAHPGFLALHFAPSDRLLSPGDLRAVRGQDIPVDLLMHPVPTEVDVDAFGKETWALRLRHPEHLPGPAIEIEGIPRSVPLATAVTLQRTLARAFQAGKLALAQGDTISPTGKWALHVFRLAPDLAAPQGRIVLSFHKERVAFAPPVTDPGLATVETAPQADRAGFAAMALAALRKSEVKPLPQTPHNAVLTAPITPKSTAAEAQPALRAMALNLRPVELPPLCSETETRATYITPARPKVRPELRPGLRHRVEAGTPPPEAEIAPVNGSDRVSLLGWMVARCRSLPKDGRATASGVALVVGLSTAANPYEDFTGGHDTRPGPQHGIAQSAPGAEIFAALLD